MTTKTLIAGPKLKTAIPGPNAKRILAGDEQYISPSYTRSYPMVAKRGRGIVVEDVDGNEFFDFSAGIAVVSTGHCHPDVVAAIRKQAGELIHMSGTDFYYEGMVTLAERLSKIAPMPGPHKIYYGNSGAEAIECALKLARYHTKRQHIIAFLGAFHGRTMGALSLTASKPQQKRRFSPMVPGVTHVRYPDVYRGCVGGPQDAEKFALGCARYIEDKLFKTVLAPEEVAAIFVEPIQGEGGYVIAPTVFMQELRRICDQHGILLVVDEVQSGIGRTGKWFAVEHSGRAARHGLHREGHCFRDAARRDHEQGGNHGLGARFARVDFWRESGVHRRGAGHARRDRERRAAAEFAGSRRPHAEAHGGLAEEAQDCRRRSRARPDDRRRHRQRPGDSRVRQQRARSHRRSGVRARRSVPGLRSKHDSHRAAAHRYQGRSRRCHGCAGRVDRDR